MPAPPQPDLDLAMSRAPSDAWRGSAAEAVKSVTEGARP
jgi:hypothetical protein